MKSPQQTIKVICDVPVFEVSLLDSMEGRITSKSMQGPVGHTGMAFWCSLTQKSEKRHEVNDIIGSMRQT